MIKTAAGTILALCSFASGPVPLGLRDAVIKLISHEGLNGLGESSAK
jgi:hypothetical protein